MSTDEQAQILAKTDAQVARLFPNESLRAVLPQPLKLPGGWRVVYESFPHPQQVGLRQCGTMVVLFVSGRGEVEEIPERSELSTDARHEYPRFEKQDLENLILRARLPALQEAVNLVTKEFRGAVIASQEPVINTLMTTNALEVLCWRFDVFVGSDQLKVYVGYKDSDRQTCDYISEDITSQHRFAGPPSRLPRFRNLKRYGRLDLNHEARKLGIRVDLSWQEGPTAFRQERLMEMRDGLIVWFCKEHLKNYLEYLGYDGLDYSTISSKHEKNDGVAEMAAIEASRLNSLGVVYLGRESLIVSPIVSSFRDQSNFPMISWLQDPSIVFHELGHAVTYLLYTPELHRGIEEGFCDYLSAVLMDDLLKTEGFAYRQLEGIGSLLPGGIHPGRFLPRRFGGQDNPPHFDSIADSERPYQVGWHWAHFLWHLRRRLSYITGDPLAADKIITSAHFKPRPQVKPDVANPFPAYQQSLLNTMRLNGISMSEGEWNTFRDSYPLPI